MWTHPLLADFIHSRLCKPFCEIFLTLPSIKQTILFYSLTVVCRKLILFLKIFAMFFLLLRTDPFVMKLIKLKRIKYKKDMFDK